MVIMAIAAAIVLPNIRGMISNTQESLYKSYCTEASTYVKGYTNLLTLGEEYVPYEKNGMMLKYYIKDNPSGLTAALNEYNLNSNYQYYVLPFDKSSAGADPTTAVRNAISGKTLLAKDVIVTVIMPRDVGGRVPKYVLLGFWYFNYSANNVVYTYDIAGKTYQTGYKKLTTD